MKVFQAVVGCTDGITAWYVPLFLVIPVYQARFSAVTFEYSMCLAAAALAWKHHVCGKRKRDRVLVSGLLVIAVGVPSLAVLFPLIAFTGLLVSREKKQEPRIKSLVKHFYILVIPLTYSLIFSLLINSSGKYVISWGGVAEFVRGLIALTVMALFVSWHRAGRRLRNSRVNRVLIASVFAAYLGFFPYLAVGFNPIADFLPWRIRDEVQQGLMERLLTAVLLLSILAAVSGFMRVRVGGTNQVTSSLSAPAASVALGAVAIAMGPMDWDSRHWLIAWPFLVAVFLAATMSIPVRAQNRTVICIFVVFLAASTVVSAEFLVDSMKQRAIVDAFKGDRTRIVPSDSLDGSPILITTSATPSTSSLNARFRTYRSHEWWGIAVAGLSADPDKIWVLEQDDFVPLDDPNCVRPLRAVSISPVVSSNRFDVLIGRGVDVSLNPVSVLICPLEVRAGWPRDRSP